MKKELMSALLGLAVMGLVTAGASASELSIRFLDPIGDNSGYIDIVSMEMNFSNLSGEYEIKLTATPDNSFNGEFRINVNLYNPAGLYPDFHDTLNDFSVVMPTTTLTLTGISARLVGWDVGDQVASSTTTELGNPPGTSLFRTGAADLVSGSLVNCVNPFPNICNEDAIAAGDVVDVVEIAQLLRLRIDIKPASEQNSINIRPKGVISVAILSTNLADGESANFDATTVDPLSVEFGPTDALEAHGRGHIEDVDKDGDLDLLLHFRTQEAGIKCGDAFASLSGQTFDDVPILGSDSIKTVPCN